MSENARPRRDDYTMIFSNKHQEVDALVVQAAAVLRAIRQHDDNCGKELLCF
jgi:hypothetical protein